jgi:hypothetical protein
MDEKIITIKQTINYNWQGNTGTLHYTIPNSPKPDKIRIYSDRITGLLANLSNNPKIRTLDLRKLKLIDNYIHFTFGDKKYKLKIPE